MAPGCDFSGIPKSLCLPFGENGADGSKQLSSARGGLGSRLAEKERSPIGQLRSAQSPEVVLPPRRRG